MVRTKDAKVVLGKSSRKGIPITDVEEKTSKGGKYSGGNPYCPRETPAWQKPITRFFQHHNKDMLEDELNNVTPSGSNNQKDTEKEMNSSGVSGMSSKKDAEGGLNSGESSDVSHEKKDKSENILLSSDDETMFDILDIDTEIKDCEIGHSDESNEASTHF